MTGYEIFAQAIHSAYQPFRISFNERFGNIQYLLCRAIVVGEHNAIQIVRVVAAELLHVFDIRTLETVNALIVIANDKNVRLFPIVDQESYQPVLRSARILVFINKNILEALLVVEEQIFI